MIFFLLIFESNNSLIVDYKGMCKIREKNVCELFNLDLLWDDGDDDVATTTIATTTAMMMMLHLRNVCNIMMN